MMELHSIKYLISLQPKVPLEVQERDFLILQQKVYKRRQEILEAGVRGQTG